MNAGKNVLCFSYTLLYAKAYIPIPIPTNVVFGRGEQSNILYITAANDLYQIKVGKKGYHLPRAGQ